MAAAAIQPVWDQSFHASLIKCLLNRQERCGLHRQELRVSGAVAEIEAGQERIDLVMSSARHDSKIGMGAQAVGPNTRPKITSMRLKW